MTERGEPAKPVGTSNRKQADGTSGIATEYISLVRICVTIIKCVISRNKRTCLSDDDHSLRIEKNDSEATKDLNRNVNIYQLLYLNLKYHLYCVYLENRFLSNKIIEEFELLTFRFV